jgi:hypothetical protein
MSLDFNEFLNVKQHHKNIEHGAQEIRERYAPRPGATKQYVHDLFGFFLDNITKAASEIYKEILQKKDRLGSNFSLSMGGMFRDLDDADKDKTLFNEEAKALCKKQGEIFETQYIKLLEKNRREYWTYVGAIVGGIAGVISLIGTAIVLIKAKAVTVVIKSGQYIFSMLRR